MSAEFAGHVFSISFAQRYAYVNSDIMASIGENATYQFVDVISKKTCDVIKISKNSYNRTWKSTVILL